MRRTGLASAAGLAVALALIAAMAPGLGCIPKDSGGAQTQAPAEATHEQVATIAIPMGEQKVAIHSFCLSGDGNLLAACGGERMVYTRTENGYEMKMVGEPSGIRVVSPEGKLLATWPLDVTPQAVNVAPDGTIYCGGQGRIARLDPRGKVLKVADAPHVAELPPVPPVPPEEKPKQGGDEAEKAKEAKIAKLKERRDALMKDIRAIYKERKEAKDDETKKAQVDARYEKVLAEYRRVYDELRPLTTSARTLAIQQRSAAMRKRAVTGIAVTKRDVFVACPTSKGYGYDVWRMDRDLGAPTKIVTGLRGCCGQMDIQAAGGTLYAAENARKRVVCYDRDGKQLATWGSDDRKSLEGFGSCCNPMNLRVGPKGDIYTSEASVGRIRRYSPSGKLLSHVGTATIVPGCKHVAIAIDRTGDRVYMLDITRAHIVVMERRGKAGRQIARRD